MNIGDEITACIWIDGEETPEMRRRYEAEVTEAMDYLCASAGFTYSKLRWTEKHPEDEDVPPVPDHVTGRPIRLLVAEGTITGKRVQTKPDSFVANLGQGDLLRLREMTRAAYANHFRGQRLSDAKCDDVIEAIGPDAALDALRRAKLH